MPICVCIEKYKETAWANETICGSELIFSHRIIPNKTVNNEITFV